MVDIKVIIKMKLTEDKFNTDEFQEFLNHIKNGKMADDMQDESEFGNMFSLIKIFYFIKKPPSRNKGEIYYENTETNIQKNKPPE